MSRGRKAIIQNNSGWEGVFYNSVGTYVQYINQKLAEQIKSEPLSNHIRIAGGYAFKSSQYKKHGVPVIRISDFSNEKIVLDDVVYYEESEALEKYELHEGDIVIALTGGTIAKLGMVQRGIGKLYLNQRVGKFEVLHPDMFETEYVYWIARSVQSIIKNLAWGAAIPNVSPKQIEELQFPIPDKETQNGIIDFLNDLRANKLEEGKEYFNSKVEEFIFSLQVNQISSSELKSELIQQQSLAKQLRQQFLQEAVQGKLVAQDPKDEPASELLKRIKAEKVKLISEKKLKKDKELLPIKAEDIPFEIPENWTWCKLGEILSFGPSNGFSPKESTLGIGIKCLTLTATTSGIFKEQFYKLVDEQISQNSYLWLESGDILIQRGNSIDYVGIAALYEGESHNFIFPDLMIKIRLPELINTRFIHQVLISPPTRKYYADKAFGAQKSMPKINQPVVLNTLIPLPPLSEQHRIVEKLEELMQTCDELEGSIKQSASQNEKLLQQVLREALRKEVV